MSDGDTWDDETDPPVDDESQEQLAESDPDRNQWPEEPEEVDEDTDSA